MGNFRVFGVLKSKDDWVKNLFEDDADLDQPLAGMLT